MDTAPNTPQGRPRYSERVVIQVARQFYMERLSQKDIAAYWRETYGYQMSQSTVSRMLDRAVKDGIVRVSIHPSRIQDLEQRLADKLRSRGIRKVFVVLTGVGGEALENLGACGAEVLLDTLRQITSQTIRLTMSCGTTLSAVVEHFFRHVEPDDWEYLRQKTWELYPTYLVDHDQLVTSIHPHALVATFAIMLTRSLNPYNFPNESIKAVLPSLPAGFYDLEESAQADLLAHSHIRDRIAQGETADIFLFGIGHLNSYTMQMLKRLDPQIDTDGKDYIAESNFIPFCTNGDQNETIERKLVGLGIEKFRQMLQQPEKHIIAIAGSKAKQSLIHASLAKPYYNILVISDEVADYLLTQL